MIHRVAAAARIAGALLVLALLAQSTRVLWKDARSFHFATVVETNAPSLLPAGAFTLTEFTPVGRLRVGDLIAYSHPLRERAPVYARVGQVSPVAHSTGYLARLDLGGTGAEPWYAELHGTAVRVVIAVVPPPGMLGRPGAPVVRSAPADGGQAGRG